MTCLKAIWESLPIVFDTDNRVRISCMKFSMCWGIQFSREIRNNESMNEFPDFNANSPFLILVLAASVHPRSHLRVAFCKLLAIDSIRLSTLWYHPDLQAEKNKTNHCRYCFECKFIFKDSDCNRCMVLIYRWESEAFESEGNGNDYSLSPWNSQSFVHQAFRWNSSLGMESWMHKAAQSSLYCLVLVKLWWTYHNLGVEIFLALLTLQIISY